MAYLSELYNYNPAEIVNKPLTLYVNGPLINSLSICVIFEEQNYCIIGDISNVPTTNGVLLDSSHPAIVEIRREYYIMSHIISGSS